MINSVTKNENIDGKNTHKLLISSNCKAKNLISIGLPKTLKPVIQLLSIWILLECKTGQWEDHFRCFSLISDLCCRP